VAGRGRFGAEDGREHVVALDELVLLTPGTFQDYSVEPSLHRWTLLWAHFRVRPEWLDLLDWPAMEPGMLRLSLAGHPLRNEVLEQFERVHSRALATDPLRDRLAMNALEGLLLLCEQANPKRGTHAAVDARIRQTMDYVTRHLAENLTLDSLSAVSGLSESRLGHRFREVVGLSPMAYVEQQRIERAKQLLTMTSLSVKEISRQVGYETQFYFSLRFKRATGASPTDFRERSMQV
jgi:AraC family transcriptional regulator of arabinose operon